MDGAPQAVTSSKGSGALNQYLDCSASSQVGDYAVPARITSAGTHDRMKS